MANETVKQTFLIEVDGQGKLTGYTKELKNNEKQTEKNKKSNTDFSKSIRKLEGDLAKLAFGFASVATAIKGAKLIVELGELGAKVTTVDKSFQKFASDGGRDAEKMMADLRKASGGLADDMFLQQQAMKAMIAGVDFSTVVTSLEYVRKYSIATGEDMNAKFQTVMTGLARGSAQFLDDVGIQVMGSKDVVNDAVAQMQEKMGQFADTSNDASTKIATMKTRFENLKQEIGDGLTPTVDVLLDQFTEIADEVGTGKVVTAITQGVKYINAFFVGVSGGLDAIFSGISNYLLEFSGNVLKTFSILNKYSPVLFKVAKNAGDMGDALKEQAKEENALLKERLVGYGDLINDIMNAKKAEDQLGDAIDKTTAKVNKRVTSGSAGGGGKSKAKGSTGTDMGVSFGPMPATDLLLAQIEDTSELQTQSLDSWRDYWNDYAGIAQESVNSISNLISSMYNKQINDMQAVTQREIEAVKASTMSEKKKAKEIDKINKEASKKELELRKKQWKLNLLQAIANTALAVTSALTTQPFLPMGPIMAGVAAVTGGAAIATVASNKPRYYYGSRDASGAFTEVGGSGSGDSVQALVKSGEMIVSGKSNVETAKNALNGVAKGMQTNVQMGGISLVVQGNADESTIGKLSGFKDTVQDWIYSAIEDSRYTNGLHRGLA